MNTIKTPLLFKKKQKHKSHIPELELRYLAGLITALIQVSLYSKSNLPSLQSLRCNYGGQLYDEVVFVLTLICY